MHDHGHEHPPSRDPDRSPAAPVRRMEPVLSRELDGGGLWKLFGASRARTGRGPDGREEALRRLEGELDALGLPASIHECEVYDPPSDDAPDGVWRRHRFPVVNVVPDGGALFFLLVAGEGDASLLEMARLAHLHRNELTHAVRFAWWNGTERMVFGASAWYADHNFDLLRSRCLAYLNVGHLAGTSRPLCEPYATAELTDWLKAGIDRLSGLDTEPGPAPKEADGHFLGVGLPCFALLAGLEGPGEATDPDRLAERTRLCADAMFDMAVHPRAPINLMAVADVLWGELEVLEREAGGGFDFGEAKEAVKELVVVLEDHEHEYEEMDPMEANRMMLDICHFINPVLYTLQGPYGHDTGGNPGVLPGLRRALALPRLDPESPDAHLLRTLLVRERNRISDHISKAVLIARG